MLIAREEVEYLDELLLPGYPPELADFLIQRSFHFFLGCGFDEVRAGTVAESPDLWQSNLRDDLDVDIINTPVERLTCDSYVYARMQRLLFRRETTGAWYRLAFTSGFDSGDEPTDRYSYVFGESEEGGRSSITIRGADVLRGISNANETVSPRCSLLLLPGPMQARIMTEGVPIADHIRTLIADLHNSKVELRTVHWRHLEELVAELLQSKGLQIEVTPRTRDGGRDIIARGKIIPGEPSIIAVEVKQKAIVGLEDVQRALRANRNFPALLFATSGRFTAGVVKEARQGDTAYRLFLKDGIGLLQWVHAYAQRHG